MEREGEGTKFTIDRKIFSSDIWFDASPWRLKIWIYLFGNANHTDGSFMGIKLKRGQLIRSYRTIAKDCAYKIGYRLKKPSIGTVHNTMIFLKNTERIQLQKIPNETNMKKQRSPSRSEHLGYIITILNYNDLQPLIKHELNTELNTPRTPPEHNKNVYKNVKNEKNTYSSVFLEFWNIYPKRVGKMAAFKSWKKLTMNNGLKEIIIKSVTEHCESEQWKKDNGQYIPNPSTYLNQHRWEDEIKTNQEEKRTWREDILKNP